MWRCSASWGGGAGRRTARVSRGVWRWPGAADLGWCDGGGQLLWGGIESVADLRLKILHGVRPHHPPVRPRTERYHKEAFVEVSQARRREGRTIVQTRVSLATLVWTSHVGKQESRWQETVTLATWGTMCPLLVNVRQLQGYSHVPHHFFFLNLIGPLKKKSPPRPPMRDVLLAPFSSSDVTFRCRATTPSSTASTTSVAPRPTSSCSRPVYVP